jgi:signal transduction histidine kinase
VWFQTKDETTWIVDHTLRKVIAEITNMDLLISAEQIDENNFLLSGHHILYEYNLKTKSRKNKYTLPEDQRINDFTSKDGFIFVSTSDGLHVLNKQFQRIEHLLKGIHVRKTIIWKQGTLVIGTYGKGVYFLKDNKIYPSQTKRNPQLSAVVNLATDSDSALWVICNKAAFVWNELRFSPAFINDPDHVLYVQKELPCSELNGGLTPDVFPNNDILLPSSDGLLIMKKEDIIKPVRHFKVGISKVLLDDSLVVNQTGFSIPAGNNHVSFYIDCANLDDHRGFIPQYRILGLDSQWRPLPDDRTIELKRMPRGTYHLEIIQMPDENPVMLSKFMIQPFWHETLWARILMMMAAIALVYAFVKLRIRNIEAQNVKLEQIIDEKTKSLQENIIKLDASEKNLRQQYKYRNKLYSILVHDLKSPLSFLAAYSSKQLAEKQVIEMDTMRTIAKSSTELSTYVNEFLYWLGNQYSPENIQIASTNISTLLEEVADFYQNVATINENRLFFFDKEKNIKFPTDANRLKIVIRNLLDNANKYTTKGIIKISHLLDQDGSLIIKIEDSGKGLPDNIVSLIHDQSNTQQIAPNINANYKMGLMISKELVEQLGGKISVVSDEKTGTTFTLAFNAAQEIHAG